MTNSKLPSKSFVQKFFSRQNLIQLILNLGLFAGVYFAIDWFQTAHLLEDQRAVDSQVFALPVLQSNQRFDHQQLQGKKTVAYFFAPWCQVCHLSMGNLQNLYDDRKDEINVIAVALSFDSTNEISEFVDNKQLTFPVLLGNDAVMSHFKVRGFPTYYVLDEQGRVTGKTQGYSTEVGLRLRAM